MEIAADDYWCPHFDIRRHSCASVKYMQQDIRCDVGARTFFQIESNALTAYKNENVNLWHIYGKQNI